MQKNILTFFFMMLSLFFLMICFFKSTDSINMFFMLDENTKYLMFMTNLMLMMSILLMMKKNSSLMVVLSTVLLMWIFFFIFMTNNMLYFYIMFEISVLPLIILISSWGYSLERIKASMYMFLYTFFFSLPFLILMSALMSYFSLNLFFTKFFSNSVNNMTLVFMMFMFLVKVPLWSMHLWLLKAHVEASTEGSMILASVVLKMAGVGLMKYSMYLINCSLFSFSVILKAIGIWGAIIISLLIVKQTDMKMIVAMSSIVHMVMMFLIFFFFNTYAFNTMLIVMISHGLISPMMFLFVGMIYDHNASRSLHLIKGFLKMNICISMLWFILCIFNMGMPLSMNFIGELMFYFVCISHSKMLLLFSVLIVFFNGLFNMYLFSFSSAGKKKKFFFDLKPANLTTPYISIIFIIFSIIFLNFSM